MAHKGPKKKGTRSRPWLWLVLGAVPAAILTFLLLFPSGASLKADGSIPGLFLYPWPGQVIYLSKIPVRVIAYREERDVIFLQQPDGSACFIRREALEKRATNLRHSQETFLFRFRTWIFRLKMAVGPSPPPPSGTLQ